MFRPLLLSGAFAGALALSSAAEAAMATGDVNLRTGPGTQYAKITVVPRGAYVDVYRCASWCEVNYNGRRGWVSGSYITEGRAFSRRYVERPVRVLPRRHWRDSRPWWDDRYSSWRDRRGWYYSNRWHDRPRSGIYLNLDFD